MSKNICCFTTENSIQQNIFKYLGVFQLVISTKNELISVQIVEENTGRFLVHQSNWHLGHLVVFIFCLSYWLCNFYFGKTFNWFFFRKIQTDNALYHLHWNRAMLPLQLDRTQFQTKMIFLQQRKNRTKEIISEKNDRNF